MAATSSGDDGAFEHRLSGRFEVEEGGEHVVHDQENGAPDRRAPRRSLAADRCSATEITIDCGLFVSKQLHLVGSLGGQKADAENVYALIDSGELEITVTEITFDEIGEGIERLHRGGLLGRLVALITPGN